MKFVYKSSDFTTEMVKDITNFTTVLSRLGWVSKRTIISSNKDSHKTTHINYEGQELKTDFLQKRRSVGDNKGITYKSNTFSLRVTEYQP